MFSKILVPVDFTDRNAGALRTARELAGGPGGEVDLLHVIEPLDGEVDEELEGFYGRLEQRARERMRAALEELGEGRYVQRSHVLFGPRAPTIVGHAEKSGADLIVMGSHRLEPEGFGADWLTLSYRVALLAPCPVLLVK